MVIGFESTDELHRSSVEGVDVLIVVAYREEGELAILIFKRPTGKGRYQRVLICGDVLVFIHQDPAESRKKSLPPLVRFLRLQSLAPQQFYSRAQHISKRIVVDRLAFTILKTDADQSHGKCVTGKHGYATGVVADQIREAPSYLNGCMSIVGQCQNASGILPPCTYEVGYSMDEYACLAGTRASEHKHVCLLPVIGDDTTLDRILQAFYDRAPGLGRGLPFDLPGPVR